MVTHKINLVHIFFICLTVIQIILTGIFHDNFMNCSLARTTFFEWLLSFGIMCLLLYMFNFIQYHISYFQTLFYKILGYIILFVCASWLFFGMVLFFQKYDATLIEKIIICIMCSFHMIKFGIQIILPYKHIALVENQQLIYVINSEPYSPPQIFPTYNNDPSPIFNSPNNYAPLTIINNICYTCNGYGTFFHHQTVEGSVWIKCDVCYGSGTIS